MTHVRDEHPGPAPRLPTLPAHHVPRPRLSDLLDRATTRRVTLVLAEAGTGKTTAVSEWAATRAGRRVAWLTLDGSYDDPPRLRDAVADALDVAGSAQRGAPRDVLLVLDDVHTAASAAMGAVESLMATPPAGLRVVLVGRPDPGLRFDRLRLAGHVAHVGLGDLALTRDEARAVLAGIGAGLTEAQVADVHRRADGWAAAVVIVGMAARELADGRAHDDGVVERGDAAVLEYLLAQVVRPRSAQVQAFLLRTSVVDALDDELADALVTGGRALLREVASAGLFLAPTAGPAAPGGRRMRYPQQVRELLTAQLAVEDPAGLAEAHRAAARCYADRGEVAPALAQAVAGRDLHLAATLVTHGWLGLLAEGELDGVAPLLSSVSAERVRRDPDLAVALAAVSLQLEPHDRAVQRWRTLRGAHTADTRGALILDVMVARSAGDAAATRAAADRLLTDGRTDPPSTPELRSLVLSIVGTAESWTGDVRRAREHLRAALSAADEAGSAWLRFIATGFLAEAEAKCGDIAAATHRVDQTLAAAREHGWMRSSSTGAAAMMGALIATLRCRFDEAARLVEIAEGATRRPRDRPERAALALPRLVLMLNEGRVLDGLDEIRRARSALGDWPADPVVLDTLQAWEARLLAAVGATAEADAVLRAEPRGPLTLSTTARLALDRGDVTGALAAIGAARAVAETPFPSVAVDVDLVDALALRAAGRRAESTQALERALDVAAPAGFLRPLVSHGPLLATALERHARAGTKHGAFVAEAITSIRGRTGTVVPMHAEALSPREREVLGYLPSPMSNDDIARALFVSVNTVKTHARAIYRKLGVDNRREAVARAHELGLLGAPSLRNLDLSPR